MKQKKAGTPQSKQEDIKDQVDGRWKLILAACAVALITLLTLISIHGNSFINWDDNAYVFENDQIGRPLSVAIKYYFQAHYVLGGYTPVTMSVFTMVFHMAGTDPAAYHMVSITFHLVNVLLVFWFIYLLSQRKIWVAVIVSLLFGIHPMHVESVAWVAELKDVLYTAFFLAGLICYYKYISARNIGSPDGKRLFLFLVLTFVLFLLSVLSKPAAVTFPVVLLLLDFYLQRRFDIRVWIEKLPFIAVAVVIGFITLSGQSTYPLMHDSYTIVQRVVFASFAFLEYFWKLILPFDLSIYYPYPKLVNGHTAFLFYLAPFVVLAMFYGVYKTLKHDRFIAFGFLFFFINMVLVLQVISGGMSLIADHYTYMSYIGLFFIIAMVFEKWFNSQDSKLRIYGKYLGALIFVFSAMCVYAANNRCGVWKDEDTMAADILAKYPNEAVALNNSGFIMHSHGNSQAAIDLFAKAIAIRPTYAFAYVNLVNAYIAIKDYENAEKTADTALKIIPGNADILNSKGYACLMRQNYPVSIEAYNKAIAINPFGRNSYLGLAECYFEQKDYLSEIKVLDKGLQHIPDNFLLLNYKGYALFLMGKYKEAASCFIAALKEKPDFQPASINLDNCYKAMTGGNR